MFSLSDRSRRSLTKKVNKKTPAGWPPATNVVKGVGIGGWTTTLTVICVLFAAGFIYALTQGIVLIPGLLLFAVGYSSFKPGRLVAVSPLGIVSYSLGGLIGGPKDVVGTTTLVPFPPTGGPATVQIGEDTVKLDAKEYGKLVELTVVPVGPRENQSLPTA